jgi:F-type H+-transporting ATPase subunit delta
MNQSKIPVRYAKALFLLAKEKGILSNLSREAGQLAKFFAETPALMGWLRSPVIKTEEKKELFHSRFEGQFSELLFKFIDLVISKKRERFFPDILRNFLNYQKADAGIKTLTLTTAVEVDNEFSKKISHLFVQKNAGIELVSKIKPSIIGGFTLQVDDTLYDASLATEIKRLNKELTGQILAEIGTKAMSGQDNAEGSK